MPFCALDYSIFNKKNLLIFFLFLNTNAWAVDQVIVEGLFADKVVLMIDGQRHILKVGDVTVDGVKVVSANSKDAVLEISGQQKTHTLGTSVSLNYAKAITVKEQILANEQGMFLTYGAINGQTARFLIDTGASSVALNSIEAKRLGVQYREKGKLSSVRTASGVEKAWSINLKSVKLGKIHKKNVHAMVLDGSHPSEILLGMSFMNGLNVNKVGRKLVLEQKK